MEQGSGLLTTPFLQMFKQTSSYFSRLIQDIKDNPACYLLTAAFLLFCRWMLITTLAIDYAATEKNPDH